jgi:hypothetical protein
MVDHRCYERPALGAISAKLDHRHYMPMAALLRPLAAGAT